MYKAREIKSRLGTHTFSPLGEDEDKVVNFVIVWSFCFLWFILFVTVSSSFFVFFGLYQIDQTPYTLYHATCMVRLLAWFVASPKKSFRKKKKNNAAEI